MSPSFHDWRHPFWLALLIGASVTFTLGFACAAPFAAFSAAAALTLARREAYCLTLGVGLANQVIGFAFLNYPWDANCLAWGAAIGVTAVLSTLAARQAVHRLKGLNPIAGAAVIF